MKQKSIETINSVPYHEQRIKVLDALYQQLNPEEAEKVQRDKEYQEMKSELQEMRKLLAHLKKEHLLSRKETTNEHDNDKSSKAESRGLESHDR